MTRSRNRAVKGRRKESREGHVGPEKVWWWCFFADRWVFHLRIPQLRPVYCTGLLVCLPDLSFLPSNACHSPDRTFSGSPALTGQRPDIQGTTFKPLHCLFPPLSPLSPSLWVMHTVLPPFTTHLSHKEAPLFHTFVPLRGSFFLEPGIPVPFSKFYSSFSATST